MGRRRGETMGGKREGGGEGEKECVREGGRTRGRNNDGAYRGYFRSTLG